ncbi:MAG: diguanylate cyclase [Actinomycetota bacterium]|nr:diguanylate cyclase [Actinomycetota bacterium]
MSAGAAVLAIVLTLWESVAAGAVVLVAFTAALLLMLLWQRRDTPPLQPPRVGSAHPSSEPDRSDGANGSAAAAGGPLSKAARTRPLAGEPRSWTDPGVDPDPVSGLPGPLVVQHTLADKFAVARRHLWPVTVIQLSMAPRDADYGAPFPVADLAQLLRLSLRESDLAARVGENRFVLVLDDTSEHGGVWAVERLQAALSQQSAGHMNLLAGLASYPSHALAPAEVVRLAETALQRAVSQLAEGLGNPVQVAPVEHS